jgi:hypothetical protein
LQRIHENVNISPDMRSNTIPSALIQLPTEPSYWGSDATEEDAKKFVDNLEIMIHNKFGELIDIEFEKTPTPVGNGIFCTDDNLEEEIFDWVQNNWTSALVFEN